MRKLWAGFALGVAFLPILGLIAIHLGVVSLPSLLDALPPSVDAAWKGKAGVGSGGA